MATKAEELANPNSCLNKAADDEPIFVLRAQDMYAVATVSAWLNLASETLSPEKTDAALKTLLQMGAWSFRKAPD